MEEENRILNSINTAITSINEKLANISSRQEEDREDRKACRIHCDVEMPKVYGRINTDKTEMICSISDVKADVDQIKGARGEEKHHKDHRPHDETAKWTKYLALASFLMVAVMVLIRLTE